MTARILELARSIPREYLASIPIRSGANPLPSPQRITAAVAEFHAMPADQRAKRGTLSHVCRKHDITTAAFAMRIKQASKAKP
jgi:hypothetical protein